MRVISLDNVGFEAECGRLAAIVASRFGSPDVIVGVKSGGKYVADRVALAFPGATVTYVVSRRPSTSGKKKVIVGWLKHLPTVVLDWMRIVESMLLRHSGSSERHVEVEASEKQLNQWGDLKIKVLVVDDAVDSGHTLARVTERLRSMLPLSDIRSAVITVTTDNPAVSPDYVLYDNKTLVRFPWSLDSKTRQ